MRKLLYYTVFILSLLIFPITYSIVEATPSNDNFSHVSKSTSFNDDNISNHLNVNGLHLVAHKNDEQAYQLSKSNKERFKDLKRGALGYEEVLYLVDEGIITGYGDGTFKPYENISRQHVALMLFRALDLKVPKDISKTLANIDDVSTKHYYAKEIAAVIEAGVFQGSNGKFNPNQNITRGQMASVIVRAFNLQDNGMPTELVDLKKISPSHRQNVKILSQHEITTGKTNKKGERYFDAGGTLTRVQFALFLHRTFNIPDDLKGPNDNLLELIAIEDEVVKLTNIEREKHGLKPLKIDRKLREVSRAKSNDMSVNDYFDHVSPRYGTLPDLLRTFNINYFAAAENIAQGYRTPESVVNAWMNSEGHRRNILNKDFTHIGVGYSSEGRYWTQHFIQN